MCVYFRTKVRVSRIILSSFRQGVVFFIPHNAKQAPKKLTLIRFNVFAQQNG